MILAVISEYHDAIYFEKQQQQQQKMNDQKRKMVSMRNQCMFIKYKPCCLSGFLDWESQKMKKPNDRKSLKQKIGEFEKKSKLNN